MDPKYLFLKSLADTGTQAVNGMTWANGEPVKAYSSRLRVLHGALIIDDIRSRIRTSDVLLFDLDQENPNVMLELGIALANSEDGKRIFVRMKQGQNIPSDLNGYLISFYEESDEYKLMDPKGFYAALRSAVIQRAQIKGASLKCRLHEPVKYEDAPESAKHLEGETLP